MEPSDSLEISFFSKNGVLTRKEVFRWCVHSSLILNGRNDVRSDFFAFKPCSNSKFCLLLAANPDESKFINNHFGVCLCRIQSGCSDNDNIPIKVSFSLLDIRDRLHHTCEKIMKENDRVYASFDRGIFDRHQLIFLRKGILTVHCALDVEEVMHETDQTGMNGTALNPPGKIPEVPGKTSVLVDDLMTLLENEKFCDIVLCVDGKDFRAHRAILAARSPVFAAMFEHDTLEKAQNRVIIEDVPSVVMPQLLRYLYTGKTENLNPQLSLSLFVAADKYSLPKLKNKCSNFLCANLTADMVLKVLTVANLHQDENLKEAAIQVVLDNAVQVMQTDDWLAFLKDYSELVNSIILRLAMK